MKLILNNSNSLLNQSFLPKRYTLLFSLSLVFVANLLPVELKAQSIDSIDKVVAVVNDEVITQREFESRFRQISQRLAADKVSIPNNVLAEQVMHTVIQERSLLQYAKQSGFYPEKEQIEGVLSDQAAAEGKSVNEMFAALAENGLTASEVRRQIATQIAISHVRNRIIGASINVAPVEIDAYISERMGGDFSNQTAEKKIAHIVLRVNEKASNEEKNKLRNKASEVLNQARSGAEFSDLAAKYSDFSDAQSGGILDFRPVTRFPDIYEKALKDMQPGEISDILQSSNGYHIIKLIESRSNTPQNVERVRASHILIRREKLSNGQTNFREAINQLNSLRQRITNGEKFATIAATYSQDASAKVGGDLGWLYPGDTVGEFEAAMASLDIGEISQVVETQFGWHLIKLDAKEVVLLPVDKARQLATRAIIEEKSEKELVNWIDQLVARSYIKVIKN